MTVVCVALIDADGRVLLAQRPAGKPMAGLWEFPGGKLQPGETPEMALVRELGEEGLDAFRETKHVHIDWIQERKSYWFPNSARS